MEELNSAVNVLLYVTAENWQPIRFREAVSNGVFQAHSTSDQCLSVSTLLYVYA